MLVSDIVRRNAGFFPDADAVVVPGRPAVSWATLEERTNQLGRAFLDLGLGKGDVVAVFAPNCGEYIEFFFACAKTGVLGAATNIRLAGREVTHHLNYVQPVAVLVHAHMADAARQWLDEVPSVKHVVGIGPGHGFDRDYDQLVGAQSPDDPGCQVDESDVYQLAATSGTTGVPKAATLTHRNAIAAITSWLADLSTPELGTLLQTIPLFFNPGGPAGLHPVLMKGGRTVIPPGFDPRWFLQAVADYHVTNTILVPTMLAMVLAEPGAAAADLSSLRGVTTGGSPPARELLVRAREVFGDVFVPMYGMAETYSCGLVLRRENQFTVGTDEQIRRLGSGGKPHVLMQVRVVTNDGREAPHDGVTPGEVWLSGDCLCQGYYRMPDETALSWEGGWFKSGDMATVDAAGFVTIVDRKKDIIITGGINVFSREVEEALLEHPGVAQVAVIGIPHPKWGEAIHALVVLRPGDGPRVDELLAFAAGRLAGYKKPRSLEIVAGLPIGATGKILKTELRPRYWEGRGWSI